ncbi:MAG: phosphohistidine phosphatase SixA [Agarilytica sp.]
MELFLMRHGHAEVEAPKDSIRPLSAHGKMQVADIIRENITELANVQSLIVSPYLRAQETAHIVQNELANVPKQDADWLVPNANPRFLVEQLHNMFHEQGKTSLMLVTHQPLVGIVLDELCGLEPGRHRMATASLAAIDTEVLAVNCCKLRWARHAL